jgi:hypothetical protein
MRFPSEFRPGEEWRLELFCRRRGGVRRQASAGLAAGQAVPLSRKANRPFLHSPSFGTAVCICGPDMLSVNLASALIRTNLKTIHAASRPKTVSELLKI